MSRSDKVWRGPVIAVNEQGHPTPVFYDVHSAINANGGGTNGVVITGSPGKGKSYLGFTLCMLCAEAGKKTVFLDPKNDARNLIKLSDEMDNKITQWDMSDGNQNGALDPYASDLSIEQKRANILALMNILLSNIDDEQSTILYQTILDVFGKEDPSISTLTMELQRHEKSNISVLGTQLRRIQASNPKVSGVIFKRGHEKPVQKKLGEGLTIITTNGLPLPSRTTPVSEYKDIDKLSLGVMYLITNYINEVMTDNNDPLYPKAIFIDEAWAIMGTSIGKEMTEKLLRVGRSHNTACVLLTQNVNDIKGEGLNGYIATRFAFGTKDDEKEPIEICKTMHIDESYASEMDLPLGYCFMRDAHNRVSLIKIIEQSPKWSRAFETNPEKKAENLKNSLDGLF
jgi:hypothetical protein